MTWKSTPTVIGASGRADTGFHRRVYSRWDTGRGDRETEGAERAGPGEGGAERRLAESQERRRTSRQTLARDGGVAGGEGVGFRRRRPVFRTWVGTGSPGAAFNTELEGNGMDVGCCCTALRRWGTHYL